MGVYGFNKVLRRTAGSCEIYAFVSTKSIQTSPWREMKFKDFRALTVALDVLTIYWNVWMCINHALTLLYYFSVVWSWFNPDFSCVQGCRVRCEWRWGPRTELRYSGLGLGVWCKSTPLGCTIQCEPCYSRCVRILHLIMKYVRRFTTSVFSTARSVLKWPFEALKKSSEISAPRMRAAERERKCERVCLAEKKMRFILRNVLCMTTDWLRGALWTLKVG